MYKQFMLGIIVGGLIFGGISTIAQNQIINAELSSITIKLDGSVLELDNPPIMYQDRTYLPVRKVAEAVGKAVNFDEASNTVEIGVAKQASTDGYVAIVDIRFENYGFSFDESTKIISFYFNDSIGHAKTKDKVLLTNIETVILNDKTCITKEYYENKILPLIK